MRWAAAFGMVALVALSAACSEPPESAGTARIPVGPDTLPDPDQVVEDGEHVITVEGVKKAVLEAEQLYFYNGISTVVGDTIQVSFFGDAGEFVSLLTAETGVINQRSQEMVAYGTVNVRSEDARIETEELHYDPGGNRIWSDVPTTINQQGNVIRGKGVESDPALKEIRIRGGSAVLRSEPRIGPEPRADTTGQAQPAGGRPAPAGPGADEAAPSESPAGQAPSESPPDTAPGAVERTPDDGA